MKKISILSLHLNYGGIERAIVSLANYLCNYYNIEIACTYKINEESSFKLDKKVKVKYLTDVVPNKKEFKEALKSFKLITALKEGIKSVKILNLRKKTMINYISNTDSDVIISTRDIFNKLLSKYKRLKDSQKIYAKYYLHANGFQMFILRFVYYISLIIAYIIYFFNKLFKKKK